MIIDHIDNWQSYNLGSAWEAAFDFLKDLNPESAEGEYPIDGDAVFARVMSYATKRETDADAVLEAHRKYVDIQMVLDGSERIACYPVHTLEPKVAYDAERDVQFFQYREAADIQVSVRPGTFVCLLPQDAHMPQLCLSEPGSMVKKVVVKLALDRLSL